MEQSRYGAEQGGQQQLRRHYLSLCQYKLNSFSKKMKKMSLRQSFILFLCHKTICIGFVLFCFCSYWLMYSTDLTWLWQLNLQVMRGPNPDFKKDNLKTILLWNDFFNSKHFGFGVGREPFINAGCPVTNCTIVDRSDGYLPLPIEDFNAIWFHMVDASGVHFPLKRNKHQRYIYFALESPVTMKTLYKTIPIPPDFFNWSMTYRRDSDIHFPYGWVSPISKKSPMPAMPDTKIPIWMEPDFSQLSNNTKLNEISVVVDTNLLEATGAGALVTIGLTASPFISEGFFSVDVVLVREADKGLGLEEPTVVFVKRVDGLLEASLDLIGTEVVTGDVLSTREATKDSSVVVDTNLLEATGAGALVTIGLTASPFISEGFFSVDVSLVREADKGLGLEEPTVVFDKRVDGLLEASLDLIGTEVVTGDVLPTREATKDNVYQGPEQLLQLKWLQYQQLPF
uniref:(California timema) hypothetical protein n=1 Tax=Timema californicum TaxID=61474 RepID=A0A7R9IWK7_TIMCA|nr:unnamed protein product [Timema californicum]